MAEYRSWKYGDWTVYELPPDEDKSADASVKCYRMIDRHMGHYLKVDEKGKILSYSGAGGTLRIPDGIKSVGMYAFEKNTVLRTVIFPESLETIGYYAFRKCEGLQTLVFSDGLREIKGSFEGCSSLREVRIPASVREVYPDAFKNCSALRKVWIPAELGSLTKGMFSGCRALEEVILEEGIMEIGEYVFADCEGLTEIHLPDSLEKIGRGAFKGSGIRKFQVPGRIRRIPEEILQASQIEEIVFHPGVTCIFERAFADCRNLRKITLPQNLKMIGEQAFRGCPFEGKVVIPDSTARISSYAFEKCTMEEIHLPKHLISLGEEAFAECCNLTEICLPPGIALLSNKVFRGCSRLEKINFPESLVCMGGRVTDDCEKLDRDKTAMVAGRINRIAETPVPGQMKILEIKILKFFYREKRKLRRDCDKETFCLGGRVLDRSVLQRTYEYEITGYMHKYSDLNGNPVLLFPLTVPTFDFWDREWDSYRHFLIIKHEGHLTGLVFYGGYRLSSVELYPDLRCADKRTEKFMQAVGMPAEDSGMPYRELYYDTGEEEQEEKEEPKPVPKVKKEIPLKDLYPKKKPKSNRRGVSFQKRFY